MSFVDQNHVSLLRPVCRTEADTRFFVVTTGDGSYHGAAAIVRGEDNLPGSNAATPWNAIGHASGPARPFVPPFIGIE
jgi:hypothetical protein